MLSIQKLQKIKKSSDITNFATKAALMNTITAETETKIPDITNIVTKAVFIEKATKIEIKNLIPQVLLLLPSLTTTTYLAKISFEIRMKEVAKNLFTKNLVVTAHDTANKNRERKKSSSVSFKLFSWKKVL